MMELRLWYPGSLVMMMNQLPLFSYEEVVQTCMDVPCCENNLKPDD